MDERTVVESSTGTNFEQEPAEGVLARLTDALLSDEGLQALVDEAGRATGRRIAVEDVEGRSLAWTAGDESPSLAAPGASSSTDDEGGLASRVLLRGVPVAVLRVRSDARGFTVDERALFERFGRMVALELQKAGVVRENRGMLHAGFLSDLLDDRIDTAAAARRRLGALGVTLPHHLHLLTVATRSRLVADVRFQNLADRLRRLFPDAFTVSYQGSYVVLLGRSTPGDPLREVETALTDLLAGNKWVAGLSGDFTEILETRRHYAEALKAVDLGLRGRNARSLFRYEELKVFHMAELCEHQVPLQALCHPGIFTLLDYDDEQGADLVETLRVYMRLARNPTRSAEALGVHRNTLFYRIARIEKLTGLDLADGEDLFRIGMSLKLLEFLERVKPA
jgi:PucR family transcriptional regulator, proline-responsive transcriptional activator